MKITVLLAAAVLAWPIWAQTPVQAAAEKPAAQIVNSAKAPKPQKMRKATARRHQDARHCLQRPNNDAIIRCAEEYL